MKLPVRWLVAALTAAHSAAAPAPRLAFESALTKIFADEPAPAGSASWLVSMARGERESFQLLIEAGARELHDVTVESMPPRAGGPEVELNLVGYVRTAADDRRPWAKREGVGRIGWWPDPLLPNRPFNVASGQTQPVWITVYAPPHTPAGVYHGKLQVDPHSGRKREMAYQVQVFDVDLPAEQQMRNAAFMPTGNLLAHYQPEGGIMGAEFLALYKKWVRKAFSQHLGPTFDMLMGWNQGAIRTDTTAGPLGPTRSMLLSGTGTHQVWPLLGSAGHYDFHVIDQLLDIGGEYGMRQFSIAMFDRDETWEQHSETMKSRMKEALRAYAAHLRGRGVLHEAYVYNSDEPPEKHWNTIRNNYSFVKSIVPDLKVWLCLNQPKAVQALKGSTDIWDVYIAQFDRSGVDARRREGEQVIWAVCVWPDDHPNLFIEYPGVDARAIGWLTYRYGISGFEYWGLNQWGENTGRRDWANFDRGTTRTTWRRTKWPWGDGWLLYPGERGEPLSSVRFDNLRDGFEDAELLLLLSLRGGKAEADGIADPVAQSIKGYTRDPREFEKAHRALLEALAARGRKQK
ncbi:MAG: DUF4091 domain-containing protein [Bryobacterales bacterium]|nr:DUF4091 domain-containing protein [Bryobacterales bacterium]